MANSPAYLEYFERLLRFDRQGAIAIVEQYLAGGDVEGLYVDVFMPAMVHTGREWEADRISVADEHYISEVTRDLIHQIGAHLTPDSSPPGGAISAVATCAPGERHELGLMMICDILRASEILVHFLGGDTPGHDAVDLLRRTESSLLCLSCALDIHLPQTSDLIREARAAVPGLQVLVGGAAFGGSEAKALGLGADYFARDARSLRELIPRLLKKSTRGVDDEPASRPCDA